MMKILTKSEKINRIAVTVNAEITPGFTFIMPNRLICDQSCRTASRITVFIGSSSFPFVPVRMIPVIRTAIRHIKIMILTVLFFFPIG